MTGILQKSGLFKLIVFGSILAVYLFSLFWYRAYEGLVTGGGDSWGYYAYLPATFIHKDLGDLQKTLSIRKEYAPGSVHEENGILRAGEAPAFGDKNVIKYSCGIAVCNMVPFALGHFYSRLDGRYDPDGFSIPYILFLYLNAMCAILAGLYLVFRFLREYVPEHAALFTVVILACGTNLYYFGVFNNVMAHPFLFFLWAALLVLTGRFYRKPGLFRALLIGLLAGLITLIRPTEVICLLIPALYGTGSWNALRRRIRFWIVEHRILLLGLAVGFISMGVPQIAYWKYVTGDWIYYSYTTEGFDFLDPEVYRGFFSFSNGWLVYAPLMALSIIGLFFIRTESVVKSNFLPMVLSIFVLHSWITYSWWNWNYINGFGSRPMIDIYPVLAIPVAAVTTKVSEKGFLKAAFLLCIPFFALNFFQTWQNIHGVLRTELANRAYYFQAFRGTEYNQQISAALDLNDYQYRKYHDHRVLVHEGFEHAPYGNVTTARAFSGKKSYRIDHNAGEDFPGWTIPYDSFDGIEGRKYLKITAQVYVDRQISDFYAYGSIVIDQQSPERVYRSKRLRLNNKTGNVGENSLWWGKTHTWTEVTAYLKIEKRFSEKDLIRVYFHLPDQCPPLFVDEVVLTACSR